MNANPIPAAIAKSPRAQVKRRHITWEKLSSIMSKPEVGQKNGRGWVAADIPDGARRKNRVKSVSLLVYDIDNKDVVIRLDELAEVISKKNYKAIVHSTHSHKPDSPRFRLILAVSEPISPDDYRAVALRIASELGIDRNIDRACLDVARFFYRPRCPEEQLDNYVFRAYEGEPVDVSIFKASPPSNVVTLPVDRVAEANNKRLSRDWPETDSNVSKVKQMLDSCSPDSSGDVWRAIVWSVCSLRWKVGEALVTVWSQKSQQYWGDKEKAAEAQKTLSSIIDSYDPGRCITAGTLIKHAKDNGYVDSPFEIVRGGYVFQQPVDHDSAEEGHEESPQDDDSPLAAMEKFSVTGSSRQLKEKMLADAFVMQDIAILGQWTTLYAAPNTGKRSYRCGCYANKSLQK